MVTTALSIDIMSRSAGWRRPLSTPPPPRPVRAETLASGEGQNHVDRLLRTLVLIGATQYFGTNFNDLGQRLDQRRDSGDETALDAFASTAAVTCSPDAFTGVYTVAFPLSRIGHTNAKPTSWRFPPGRIWATLQFIADALAPYDRVHRNACESSDMHGRAQARRSASRVPAAKNISYF